MIKTKSIEELHAILKTMRVPEHRYNDFKWLSRNLGINNAEHDDLPRAERLLKTILSAAARTQKTFWP